MNPRSLAPQNTAELQKHRVQYLHYQKVPVDDIVRQTEATREQALAWCREYDEDIANNQGPYAKTLRLFVWGLCAQGRGLVDIIRKAGRRHEQAVRRWVTEFDEHKRRDAAANAAKAGRAASAAAIGGAKMLHRPQY